MVGTKGRSGGKRKGAGRLRMRITLSRRSAQELLIITKQKHALQPHIKPVDIIEQWIHDHWLELDAQYQENAENQDRY